ncbi:MAG TPA: hypothetical protein VN673_15290 [Clostridia bacterium]|nr:hypothetical protein [Clostridia bacterium]
MAESDEWLKLIKGISEERDTDYFLFSGPIYEDQADRMIEAIRGIKIKRSNAALILCTHGGSADCAYQIARTFKRRYKKFTVYVFGHCKSAGTLLAVGANEIVMSEFGQFGPLDVQLADKEELFGQTPALDVQQSLVTLSKFTFDTFFDYFLKLDPGRNLSTKTAGEIAKSLALGITTPIAAQIEPLLLGRVDRSMKIAEAYSERLSKDFVGKSKLCGGYPSHSFVIDFEEAKTMFPSLREPDDRESGMEGMLRRWGRLPSPRTEWIGVLSPVKDCEKSTNDDSATGKTKTDSGTKANGGAGSGHAAMAASGDEARAYM